MNKYLFSTILFIAIFALLSFLSDVALTIRYRTFSYDEYYTLNSIADSDLSTDVAIFGTSRAQNHFYPPTISKITGKTVYNFGFEGTGLEEQLLLLDFYLSLNSKPSTLVISLDPYSFDERWLSNRPFHPERYFPYINDTAVFEHLKENAGLKAYAWRYVPLFRYIDMRQFKPLNIFNKENTFELGSRLMDKEWDGAFERFLEQHPGGIYYEINPALVQTLRSIIQKALKNGIRVVIVFSPTLEKEQRIEKNRDEVISLYKKIAEEFSVPFLDYSSHAVSKDQNNFYNSQHLKKSGAIEFSKIFARDIIRLWRE